MKPTRLSSDSNAFIGWLLGPMGWFAVVALIVALVSLWYYNEAGLFDTANDGIGNMLSTVGSGTKMGDWIFGVIIGVLSALWDFGVDIMGYDDMIDLVT